MKERPRRCFMRRWLFAPVHFYLNILSSSSVKKSSQMLPSRRMFLAECVDALFLSSHS